MSDTDTSTGLKATKGPWLRDDTALKGGIYCGDATGSLVARTRGAGFELVHRSDEELEANAHLIAAAPALHAATSASFAILAALHLFLGEVLAKDYPGTAAMLRDDIKRVSDECVAALAKAEVA